MYKGLLLILTFCCNLLSWGEEYNKTWTECMRQSVNEIQAQGAGFYSVQDDAHEALAKSFGWRGNTIQYNKQAARPSFCSGAVYVAVLNALIKWEKAQGRRILSTEAWQALLPLRCQDGEGPWGWANANGPGFGVLIHQLGAGINFTDWAKARPLDIIKMWWTEEIGGKERGHLAILVKDEGAQVLIWSSNQATDKQAGGYGLRRYPKSSIKRVLFTRITRPAGLMGASRIKFSPWLHGLLSQPSTWAECKSQLGL